MHEEEWDEKIAPVVKTKTNKTGLSRIDLFRLGALTRMAQLKINEIKVDKQETEV